MDTQHAQLITSPLINLYFLECELIELQHLIQTRFGQKIRRDESRDAWQVDREVRPKQHRIVHYPTFGDLITQQATMSN